MAESFYVEIIYFALRSYVYRFTIQVWADGHLAILFMAGVFGRNSPDKNATSGKFFFSFLPFSTDDRGQTPSKKVIDSTRRERGHLKQ